MKNLKNEKKIYHASMTLIFFGMVLMLVTLVQVLRLAPIMGLGFTMATLAAVGFGYMFTLMGFIILRELESGDEVKNNKYY